MYCDKPFNFDTDAVSPITIYISRTLLPESGISTVNETVQTSVEIHTRLFAKPVMIKLTPDVSDPVQMVPDVICSTLASLV